MDSPKKVTISWSGGKDSALALQKIISDGSYAVAHIHTVVDARTRRVGLHGVSEELIEAQARSLGIELRKLYLKEDTTANTYAKLMKGAYAEFHNEGIEGVVFGDIFLEDLKSFRETLLQESGLHGIFPLWGCSSSQLLSGFTSRGFKSIICSAGEACYHAGMLGKLLGEELFREVDSSIDVCGENGEYHSFVFDGPIFHKPVSFRLGEQIRKEYSYGINSGKKTVQRTTAFFFQDILF